MNTSRRHELDWLRVIAFALLIAYHAAIAFVPWEVWPFRNRDVTSVIELPLVFLNQWRLPLLFFISGVGTRFALARRPSWQFLRERVWRLGLPLIFGVHCVAVFSGYIGAVVTGGPVAFSTYWIEWVQRPFFAKMQHLWFLGWLLGFTLLAMPLLLWMRNRTSAAWVEHVRGFLERRWAIFLPVLPLLLIEYVVKPDFAASPAMFGYAIPWAFVFFLLGYGLATLGEPAWRSVGRAVWLAPVAGGASFTGMWLMFRIFPEQAPGWLEGGWHSTAPFITAGSAVFGLMHALNAWAWCLTALAFAQRFLARRTRSLGYWNDAVYPFYIVHLPVMLLALALIRDEPWPIMWKLPLLIGLTFLGCWVLFEGLRRTRVTRELFGIKETSSGRQVGGSGKEKVSSTGAT